MKLRDDFQSGHRLVPENFILERKRTSFSSDITALQQIFGTVKFETIVSSSCDQQVVTPQLAAYL